MSDLASLHEPPIIGLKLNSVSGPRLRRLLDNHPEMADWPVFAGVELLFNPSGGSLDFEESRFDAFIALIQLVNGEIDLDDDRFDEVATVFVQKIKAKGSGKNGANCPYDQIVDIAYECQVALLHKKLLGGFARILVKDTNNPDHVFSVHFLGSERESQVAIECKNIRKEYSDFKDLVRAVSRAIEEKKAQAESRVGYTDYVIYIDLPKSILLQPPSDYDRLIANVWNQLHLQGVEICESQVVFTATSQTGFANYLKGISDGRTTGLSLLRPVVCAKECVTVRAPRAMFLSMLYRNDEEPADPLNWSKVAMSIEDPGNLLI